MFCHECGRKIPDDSVFCPECGARQEVSLEPDNTVEEVLEPDNTTEVAFEPVNTVEEAFEPDNTVEMQFEPDYTEEVTFELNNTNYDEMKHCTNCGCLIPADSRFCPECRAIQEDETLQQPTNTQGTRETQNAQKTTTPISPEEAAKIKKRNRIILAVVGGVLALGMIIGLIIGLISVFYKPTINLNNYLTVSAEGYNTVGRAVATFDYEKFESDYGKKLSKSGSSSTFLSMCVGGALDTDSGLSNGDVVTYVWECNDEYAAEKYRVKLKYENIEYKVADLKEATAFDPFDGIDVVFSGISPNGSASIEGQASSSAAENLIYELDLYDGLANGDTVTVTVTTYDYEDPVEYCIENYGMIPSPLTKTYTVEGLDSYIQSISEVSADGLKEMQGQAEDVFNAHVAREWGEDEILKSFTYMGLYLLTSKSDDDWNDHNILYLVYKAQVNNRYSEEDETHDETNDIYWYIAYNNLLVNSDGVTTVDIMDYSTPSNTFTVDSGIGSGWWSSKSWYYYGFETLDELYKNVVTSNSESYKHEDSIDANVAPKEPKEEKIIGEKGIIFPESSEKLIDKSEVEKLSDEELRYAINELYARNGYIFKDDTLRKFYEKYDWYEKKVKSEDFSMDLFNATEKKNVQIMQKERDSRK